MAKPPHLGQFGNSAWTFHGPVEYPRQMIERHIAGSVVVEISTDREGGVSDAHVLSGPDELRRLVLSSVLDWRYDPSKHPAGSSVVTIQFHLPAGEIGDRSPVLPAYERGGGLDTERRFYFAPNGESVTLSGQQPRRLLEKLIAERAGQYERAATTEDRARLEHQVSELKRALETNNESEPIRGRLSSIQTEGLPEATLRQLQSRLPVHLGDEINPDTILRIEQALQTIDPRVKMKLENGDRGDVALAVVMEGENK
jgi:TonB family protein